MSKSTVLPVIVLDEGRAVKIPLSVAEFQKRISYSYGEDNTRQVINNAELGMSAQDAYDLHQALGRVLSSLVQPFEPWPREDES